MATMVATAVPAIGVTAVPKPCVASPVIDQQQLNGNAGISAGSTIMQAEQEVIAGLSGKLAGFDFQSNDFGGASAKGFSVFVKLGTAASGTKVFEGYVINDSPSSFFYVDTSSVDISLTHGTPFTLDLVASAFTLGVGSNNPYPEGARFVNLFSMATGSFVGATEVSGYDMAFQTYVSTAPEPSTYCMALAGLTCGGYLVRRRRKRA